MIRADRFLIRLGIAFGLIGAILAWPHPLRMYLCGITTGFLVGVELCRGRWSSNGVRRRDTVVRRRL